MLTYSKLKELIDNSSIALQDTPVTVYIIEQDLFIEVDGVAIDNEQIILMIGKDLHSNLSQEGLTSISGLL